MPFYVYILQLKDGRLYVGHSNNPPRRHSDRKVSPYCHTSMSSVFIPSSVATSVVATGRPLMNVDGF